MFLFLLCEIPLVMAISVVSRRMYLREAVLFHLPPIWIKIVGDKSSFVLFIRCRRDVGYPLDVE